MSWVYNGFWPSNQSNISVFLGVYDSYTAGIWTKNSGGVFDGDDMSIWANYKFYTYGGSFITHYGGDDSVNINVYPSDVNGSDTGSSAVFTHSHGGGSETYHGTLNLNAGWYRVFVQAYNKDDNSFNDNPGWVGLRILRWF